MPELEILAAYLDRWLDGARVLYVGDLLDAEPLFAAGARMVHVYSERPVAAPSPAAGEGAVLRRVLADGFDPRPGSFDVAIVADLSRLTAPWPLVGQLRRALSGAGLAVLTTPADKGLSYTELYDACAVEFEHVRMLGQLPFAATLLCELGLDVEPDVTVDTQLATEAGAPRHLIALASQRSFEVDGYAIIAMPVVEPGAATSPGAEPGTSRTLELQAENAQLTVQNRVLQAKLSESHDLASKVAGLERSLREHQEAARALDQVQARLAHSETHAREQSARAQQLAREVERLTELQAQAHRAELAAADSRATAAQAVADERALDESEIDLEDLLTELAEQSERAEIAEAENERLQKQSSRLHAELRQAASRVEDAQTELERLQQRAELAEALGQQLAARAELAEAQTEQLGLRLQAQEASTRDAQASAVLVVELEERQLVVVRELEQRQRAALAAQELDFDARLQRREAELGAQLAAQELDHRAQLAAREHALAETLAQHQAHDEAAELTRLEDQLRERARVVSELEQELARRERFIKELLFTAATTAAPSTSLPAPAAPPAAVAPDLHAKLDALALEVARRESELETRAWRIEALQREVEAGHAATRRLERIDEEMEVLRQALLQEHAARKAAEDRLAQSSTIDASEAASGAQE